MEFRPPLQEWKDSIINMVCTARRALSTIESLKSKEIGTARDSNLMKVFTEDDELIPQTNERIEKILSFLFEIPNLLAQKMENFTYLHENSGEAYKKKLKKYHFQDFEEEIKKVKRMQIELDECLFANKIVSGLFFVDVENLKVPLSIFF